MFWNWTRYDHWSNIVNGFLGINPSTSREGARYRRTLSDEEIILNSYFYEDDLRRPHCYTEIVDGKTMEWDSGMMAWVITDDKGRRYFEAPKMDRHPDYHEALIRYAEEHFGHDLACSLRKLSDLKSGECRLRKG